MHQALPVRQACNGAGQGTPDLFRNQAVRTAASVWIRASERLPLSLVFQLDEAALLVASHQTVMAEDAGATVKLWADVVAPAAVRTLTVWVPAAAITSIGT